MTDLRWLFYHFGPYALELEEILEGPHFEKSQFTTQSEKEFTRFRVAEQIRGYKTSLDAKVTLIIKRIVGEWSDKPLEELLDYVYFETEPMQAVKRRGEKLDFTTIKSQDETPVVIPLKASKEAEKKIAQLRARLQPFLERMAGARFEQQTTSDYIEALKAWEEEDRSEIRIPQDLIVRITDFNNHSETQGT